MKVSIITAVRNGATVIKGTIESVNAQSYEYIEHVFVDGASTDSTLEVIRSTCSRTKRIQSERDTGIYDAFAKGSRLATGDVIAYLNAGDEYIDPHVIARIVARFKSSGADAVFGDVVIVDQHRKDDIVRHYRSSRFKPELIAYGFMPAHPALFIRASAYLNFGTYDPSYRIAGDFELVARMFARGGTTYASLSEVLVRMPRGGASTSGFKSNWIITKEMLRACRQNGIATNYFKLLLRFPIKMTEWIRHGD